MRLAKVMETGFGDAINRRLEHAVPDEKESGSRLLFLITRMDSIGGAQTHVLEMCQAARKLGWEVHLSYGVGEVDTSDARLDGIELHQLKLLQREISPVQDLKAVKSIRKLIRELKPDLVSTHSSKAGIVGRFACVAERQCNVHTAHGWAICHSGPFLKKMVYRVLESCVQRFAHGVICVSEWDKLFATSKLRLKEATIKVVHNGCADPQDKGYEVALMLGIRPIRIAFVGRQAWPKQPESLLRYARYREGDVEIDFIGDGPDLEKTKLAAEGMGISELVEFHGHVEDVNAILARCQIFALVSDWEGFPLSTIEAMAMGLPTVVSNVGGAAEAVDNGVTGILVARGNEKALFEALDLLLNDFERRSSSAKHARRRYEREFGVDKMTSSALTFYESILAAYKS